MFINNTVLGKTMQSNFLLDNDQYLIAYCEISKCFWEATQAKSEGRSPSAFLHHHN